MRFRWLAALLALPAALSAQDAPLSASDSALVGRILLAEDRRDSADVALSEGLHHANARIRVLAQRARGRIGDSLFASRDSLPRLQPSPIWSEPAWRLRFRALTTKREDCDGLRVALGDSAWAVRLRAVDLLTPPCATDDATSSALRTWIDALAVDPSRRDEDSVSWHAAAHALVALARLRPGEALARVAKLAAHHQWQVRMYAARAASVLSDTVRLRTLAADADDNVKDVAIQALAKLTGHADDSLFLMALNAQGAQAVRAAAVALKGSPLPEVPAAATAAFDRWAARNNASARDTRLALLQAAGRPASDDRPPPRRSGLPPDVVALALGADVRLRVTMAPSSGGGSFVVRLRGDAAPMMAARVLALARDRYYDGLTFHRVEPDFVIQGGSPGANEYVGSTQFFRDELGRVMHVRGTVGMSTRGHDTGDAQWFINLRDNQRLDRDYTVFAEVTEGIDVVDGILEGDVIGSISLISQ